MNLKAHFIPKVRSKITGRSAMDILTGAADGLGLDRPWSTATTYFATLPTEFQVEPVIAAVDCVAGAENRFKVYVRTQAVHLAALSDMLTLGGRLEGPAIDVTLAKLRDLWRALFGPISPAESNLGPTGFLFCYEMPLGSVLPIPEIYIPTTRFLKGDGHIARVLSRFVGSDYYKVIEELL